MVVPYASNFDSLDVALKVETVHLRVGSEQMLLEAIHISNFKGLRSVEFRPGNFGCLVGENNAGKSSVLQAIVWALGRTGQLPTGLYYDKDLPVEFRLTFTNVTDEHLMRLAAEHRNRISELIIEGRLEIVVRYRPQQKCETTAIKRVPAESRYREDAIGEALQGLRPPAVARAVREQYAEFAEGLADDANITAAKAHLSAQISDLPPEQFQAVEGALPTGISTSIANLLPEAIYIPAVKDLSDDLKTSQSTTFGRLLGILLDDLNPHLAQIELSLATLNEMLNRVEERGELIDRRHQHVQNLEGRIENFLRDNFPSIRLELNVPPPELKTILNTAEIYIDDGSKDRIDNKGDGLKRSLTFALLQTYVEQRDRVAQAQLEDDVEVPARRPLLFLFEEPELYLHPRSQKVLFATLSRISENNQVVVTTHSPLFFAPGATASFVRIAKVNSEPKPEARLYPVDVALDPDNAEVFRLARFENADAAFFSRRVVLFEGESDDAYCKHVAKTLNPNWCFDTHSVSMVRVSGKGNFSKFRRFFEAFGIEVKLVADLDALFDGYQHLSAPQELAEVRDVAIAAIDARIAELGIRAEPAARQIRDKVHGNTWRQRYGLVKEALEQVRETNLVTLETVALFESLFTWEEEVARVKACREDEASRSELTPLLDGLRDAGICVLSRGAIEDYYPVGAENGSKPQRALAAIELITGPADIAAIGAPLAPERDGELTEIFLELFRGLVEPQQPVQ